jgi:vacuolar-type H+-ATPase catalytic subunit A/Vma1
MDIKEYIKNIVREIISEDELEEMSISGDAGAYSTPYAFRGNKKGENAATKAAISQGFKKASTSLPKNSKVVDYKQLFEDEYEMNQDPKTKEFTKRVKISDKDKETVKKIQALMAKEKSSNSNIKEGIEEIIKEEILKEGTYSKFKNEVKLRSKNEMLHKAIKEVKRKLMEIDRIVEYTSMMKQELSEGEEGLNYWKATTNNVSRIAEMVNELNLKIQNLQQ